MKYFVYYSDDYPDNGGVGLEWFDTEQLALNFIEQRMQGNPERELSHYKLIKGKRLKLKAAQVIAKVVVVNGTFANKVLPST